MMLYKKAPCRVAARGLKLTQPHEYLILCILNADSSSNLSVISEGSKFAGQKISFPLNFHM